MTRAVSEISAEIAAAEARIAELRHERVISMLPADWTEIILGEVRAAFEESDFETWGQARDFAIGESVRVILRVEINDPDVVDDDPDGEVE